MQAITHFFSGVFLSAFLTAFVQPTWLAFVLLFPAGIGLHFLIDALAFLTYHPPVALKDDKFWVAWHVIVYAGSVAVAVVFWVPHFWAMLAAMIPDICDWLIIRPACQLRGKPITGDPKELPRFMFHHWIARFRTRCFPWLPDWTLRRAAVVPEIAIWVACMVAVAFIA